MSNRYVLLALRLLVAGVFLLAAYSKLKQSYLVFALSIDSYQLLPEWAVLTVARVLPPIELVLGLALLVGWRLQWFSLAALLLLGVFFTILVFSYGRGMTIDCGCFGVGEALSPKTLARDAVLLAAAASLWWMSRRNAKIPV